MMYSYSFLTHLDPWTFSLSLGAFIAIIFSVGVIFLLVILQQGIRQDEYST